MFDLAQDIAIRTAAERFGAPCIMTSKRHQSGMDRIAEAMKEIEADVIVNLQGDEPRVDPAHIDQVAELLLDHQDVAMATLAASVTHHEHIANPNIVKVVRNLSGHAVYFSRSVIPYDREAGGAGTDIEYLRHLGIYAYRKHFLMTLTSLPQTPLEKAEKLEQLRALEHGYHLLVGKVTHVSDGIDTLEQYRAFVQFYRNDPNRSLENEEAKSK